MGVTVRGAADEGLAQKIAGYGRQTRRYTPSLPSTTMPPRKPRKRGLSSVDSQPAGNENSEYFFWNDWISAFRSYIERIAR